tara:strand:+ start:340 stop:543 length:204 start_codon:yes stop_codon:yes gene_type:complete
MKVDKHTTLVGYAEAINKTVEDLSKLVKKQQAQIIELERMVGHLKGEQYLTDNRVAKLEKSPTLLDK